MAKGTTDNKNATEKVVSKTKKVKQVQRANKDDEKYKLALKLVNKYLVNIGKEEIDDLTKFVGIDRSDIIKEVNKQSLDEMADELFKHYDKYNCRYYRKADTIALNCLRGILKEIGYQLIPKRYDKSEIIDGRSFRRTQYKYSIK